MDVHVNEVSRYRMPRLMKCPKARCPVNKGCSDIQDIRASPL